MPALYLVHHLAAVDLALADDSALAQVGSALVKLFTEGESLDILFGNDEFTTSHSVRWSIRHDWLATDEKATQVVRWLADSAVTVSIIDEDTRDWLSKVVTGESHLLRRAAEWMAYSFLQQPHFKPLTRDLFLFLLSFVNKVCHPANVRTYS